MTATVKRRLGLYLAAMAAGGMFAGAAAAQDMPPLPESIQSQGVLRVGVKCDYPPDGYLDMSGNPIGLEVELARQIAEYAFGSKDDAELVCVTSANRVPTLVGGKVDLLIATLGITEERDKVVDFSDPYTWSASTVLVNKDSSIQSMEDLKGGQVILLKGAWQTGWFDENMPETEQLRLDRISDAMQALLQGRGDGYGHDYAVHVGLVAKNDQVRMLPDRYQIGYRGVAVREGEQELLEFVNAAIARIQSEGIASAWIEEYEDPEVVPARKDLWDLSKAPK